VSAVWQGLELAELAISGERAPAASRRSGEAEALRHPLAGDAREHGAGTDRRPVLIHGQFLREDQVESLGHLGILPSLFPMHTDYGGDWHMSKKLGPVDGQNISPAGWVLKRGMKSATHHDAPVAFPDSMRVLDATVSRVARGSGKVIEPQYRVDMIAALKAMTILPAWQHDEEASKGSIEVGKLADFVILSRDPTQGSEHHRPDQGQRDHQGRPQRVHAGRIGATPGRRVDRACGRRPGRLPALPGWCRRLLRTGARTLAASGAAAATVAVATA
jgi:hypothetical protein